MDNLRAPSSAALSTRRDRGFTIVEMLMVAAITGVLLSLAVPQVSNYMAGKSLRAQVSSLASSIRLARSEAIRRGRQVTICRSDLPEVATPACSTAAGDWNSGWLVFEDNPPRGTLDAADVLIRVQPPTTTQGNIQVVGGGNYFLTFQPTGMPVQGNPLVPRTISFLPNIPTSQQANSPLRRSIVIDFGGRIRVTNP